MVHHRAFFAALCERSGCDLLLDVNNLMVNALNDGAADPLARCKAFVSCSRAAASESCDGFDGSGIVPLNRLSGLPERILARRRQ